MACPTRSSPIRVLLPVVALALLAPGPARRSDASPMPGMPGALVASIPPRDPSAPTGSQVVAGLSSSSPSERSRAFCEEILRGNVPSALRKLRPVEMSVRDQHGAQVRAIVWVMPDYLAVGSDEDFVRVPLGLPEALTVARRFGFTLPTRKIVNSIHRQAEGKLDPKPMPAGPAMTSAAYLQAHNRTIEEQRRGLPPGALVSGN